MLWFAPFLFARMFLELEADGLFSPEILKVVLVICGVLGVLHVIAGSRALRPPSPSSTRVAAISLVITCCFLIVWFVATFSMDPYDRVRSQMPTTPLAQLVACSATMVWALQRRAVATANSA